MSFEIMRQEGMVGTWQPLAGLATLARMLFTKIRLGEGLRVAADWLWALKMRSACTAQNEMHLRCSFWAAYAHHILACVFHFGLHMRIIFWAAYAHLILGCVCTSHFELRMRIQFLQKKDCIFNILGSVCFGRFININSNCLNQYVQ